MIIILAFAMYSFIISYLYTNKTARLIHPISVISVIFLVVFIFHTSALGDVPENYTTYLVIIMGIVFFQISFYIFNTTKKKSVNCYDGLMSMDWIKVKKFVFFSFFCFLVSMIMNTVQIMQISHWSISMFISRNTYIREIYLNTHTSFLVSLFGIFISLPVYVGICTYAITISRKIKYKFHYLFMLVWFFMMIYAGIITMSRTITIIYISLFCLSYVSSTNSLSFEKRTIKKMIPIASIVVISLLVLIGFQRNYYSSSDGITSSVIDNVNEYLVVPTEAFRELMANYDSSKYGFGKYSITIFYRVGVRIGLIDGTVTNQDQPIYLSRMGNNTNVYTWFGPMYKDLGIAGVILMSTFFGIVFGLMYSPNINSITKVYINSMIVTLVFFSFFAMKTTETIYNIYFVYAYFIGMYQMSRKKIRVRIR